MRQMISRPARALLPVSLALCAVLLPGGAERALMLTAALLAARGLSLCAGGALRAAAGAVVRASRLRGNLLTAAVMAAFGGLAAIVISLTDIPYFKDIGVFTAISGAFVNMSQVFADRMYASEDRPSAAVYDIVIAALASVGLIISAADKWLMPVLTGAGMLAGILLLAGLKNSSTVQKGFRVLKYAPAALLRGWVAPAIIAAWALVSVRFETDIAALLLGIAILEWCEPVFRRSRDESAACSVALSSISAIWLIFCTAAALFEGNMPEWYSRAPLIRIDFIEAIPACCSLAMIFGAAADIRHITVAALPALSLIVLESGIFGIALGMIGLYISLGLCIAAVLLTLPDMAALRRAARARRIQKKRRR